MLKIRLLRLDDVAQEGAYGAYRLRLASKAELVHGGDGELLADAHRALHIVKAALVLLRKAVQPLSEKKLNIRVLCGGLVQNGLRRGEACKLV